MIPVLRAFVPSCLRASRWTRSLTVAARKVVSLPLHARISAFRRFGVSAFRSCRIVSLPLHALILVVLSGGCGYSTKRPFSTDIQTIHVEMFESKEFRRELEFRLTESIVKRVEMDTPYKIAPRKTADAVLTGEIIRVDNRTFGDDFDKDLPREIGSSVVVRFRVQDLRSGDILVERSRFVYQTSYIPPVGETFTQGMTRAMDGLAEQIVETMESAW